MSLSETVDFRVGYTESVFSPHVLYECETWSLMLGGIWIEGVQNMNTKTYLDLGERNKVELCAVEGVGLRPLAC